MRTAISPQPIHAPSTPPTHNPL